LQVLAANETGSMNKKITGKTVFKLAVVALK
jgi:hypothetical protein